MISPPLAALGVSLAAQPGLIWLLRRRAVMDHPNDRSSHSTPTPRGGGLAVILGMVVGLGLTAADGVDVTFLVLAVLLFGLIGALEDIWGLPALMRLVAQLVVGAVVGFAIANAGGEVIWWAVPIFAIWLAGFANAFNFMDGIDGISSVSALVAAGVLSWVGRADELGTLQLGGAVVAAASLGFLPWNAFNARVFLGDSGSYALGGALAALSGFAVKAGVPLEAAVAPLSLYLADTSWTLLRRVRAGEVWHQAHRSHVYQQLTDRGWSHPRVTVVVGLVSLGVAACGLVSLTESLPARLAADAVGALLLVGYLAGPRLLADRPMIASA